jgi:hypothetical protein
MSPFGRNGVLLQVIKLFLDTYLAVALEKWVPVFVYQSWCNEYYDFLIYCAGFFGLEQTAYEWN